MHAAPGTGHGAAPLANPPIGVCAGKSGVLLPASAFGIDMAPLAPASGSPTLPSTGMVLPGTAATPPLTSWVETEDYLPISESPSQLPFGPPGMLASNPDAITEAGEIIQTAESTADAEQLYNEMSESATGAPGAVVVRGATLPMVIPDLPLGDGSTVTTQLDGDLSTTTYIFRVDENVVTLTIAGGVGATAHAEYPIAESAAQNVSEVCS